MFTLTSRDYSKLLDQLFYTEPQTATYKRPLFYDSSFEDGVYTIVIDAAGADKNNFQICITSKNVLFVSYSASKGFRCLPFEHRIQLDNFKIEETNATYVDGVLTITVKTNSNGDDLRKIIIS